MVLSMLATIPTAASPKPKGPPEAASPAAVAAVAAETFKISATTGPANPVPSTGTPGTPDMSRRKQRNPKPLLAAADEAVDEADNVKRERRSASEDDEKENDRLKPQTPSTVSSPKESPSPTDLSNMVKVEVTEGPGSIKSPAPGVNFTPSPPPLHPPTGPRLPMGLPQLTPMPQIAMRGLVEPKEAALPGRSAMDEFLGKNNMFHFGDVTVEHHPDAPPVPMVIPMVYLVPLQVESSSSSGKSELKYRMFVPLNGMGDGGPASPFPPGMIPPQFGLQKQLPGLHVNIPRGGIPATVTSNGSRTPRRSPSESPARPRSRRQSGQSNISNEDRPREGMTTPLDLTKSPNGEMNVDDVTNPTSRRPSSANNKSPLDPQQLMAREFEAQINFLKVKQLEFLKQQQQQQQQQPESRCEECNINFSKHQNYIAHKKYYCSAGLGAAPPPMPTNANKGKAAAAAAAASRRQTPEMEVESGEGSSTKANRLSLSQTTMEVTMSTTTSHRRRRRHEEPQYRQEGRATTGNCRVAGFECQ